MPNLSKQPDSLLVDVVEDCSSVHSRHAAKPWKILVIDDDRDVHEATFYALKEETFFGRPIQLIHVYSASEARARMAEFRDVAVAIIDAVMETQTAGLDLIHDIRKAGLEEMRIVLRTGQPGVAPELSVIARYEIDDYRTKTELNRTRLITVVTSCLRIYNQYHAINSSRKGLEMIIKSARELFRPTNLEMFAWGILLQVAALVNSSPKGLVCVRRSESCVLESEVVCAAGRFLHFTGRRVSDVPEQEIVKILSSLPDLEEPVLSGNYLFLTISNRSHRKLAAVIELDGPVTETEMALVKLYCGNIKIAFDNISLVERLDELAFLDTTLQVPNLNAFYRSFETCLKHTKTPLSLGLIQIDRFDELIADHGLHLALECLRQMHAALSRLKGLEIVARVGDGTLAILGDPDQLSSEDLQAFLQQSYMIEGMEIAPCCRMLFRNLDRSETFPLEILREAVAALLHERAAGVGKVTHYDQKLRSDIERRNVLKGALKKAVEQHDGILVYLQPKIDLENKTCIGAEALVRWQYGDELIMPGEFIPISESIGATAALTEIVLQKSAEWLKETPRKNGFKISINLSMYDLNLPGFARKLLRTIEKAGMPVETFEFEVTEGIAMKNQSTAISQLQMLRDAGSTIALDDFGTGYSSLSQLQALPVDVLKIDRSFVGDLTADNARRSMAAIILSTTKALDLQCVAEGIETPEQEQALASLGCTIGQGYLYGKPCPIEVFSF
ncbi:EAL domain-containing protein (putative c-di-GMP-specific phosphodiesterase class I)/FixJ family two-component response regulator [Labrenzia sp. MBR-25]